MESGILTTSSLCRGKNHDGGDVEGGIPRLLNFLTHSFGGGTDVTGALKFAMTTLRDDLALAASDILLVTDGEIADPPVAPEVMEQLDTHKLKLGTQIHGLLIGKKESIYIYIYIYHCRDFVRLHTTFCRTTILIYLYGWFSSYCRHCIFG